MVMDFKYLLYIGIIILLIDLICFLNELPKKLYVITSNKIIITKKKDKYFVKIKYYNLFGIIPIYKYWCHYITKTNFGLKVIYHSFDCEQEAIDAANSNKKFYHRYE